MEFFFVRSKKKKHVVEFCLNGSAYCAKFLTWADSGGVCLFWGFCFVFFVLFVCVELDIGKGRIVLDLFCLR